MGVNVEYTEKSGIISVDASVVDDSYYQLDSIILTSESNLVDLFMEFRGKWQGITESKKDKLEIVYSNLQGVELLNQLMIKNNELPLYRDMMDKDHQIWDINSLCHGALLSDNKIDKKEDVKQSYQIAYQYQVLLSGDKKSSKKDRVVEKITGYLHDREQQVIQLQQEISRLKTKPTTTTISTQTDKIPPRSCPYKKWTGVIFGLGCLYKICQKIYLYKING